MSIEKPATSLPLLSVRKLLVGGVVLASLTLLLTRLFAQQTSSAGEVHTPRALFVNIGPLWLYLWIGMGSAVGGVARYWCSGIAARLFGETFPWGTLIVNIVGSFIIGFFATLTGPDGRVLVSSTARQFVLVGICGGYTTFSSFSLQTLNLLREGELLNGSANICLSLLSCLVAVWTGYAIALALNSGRWL